MVDTELGDWAILQLGNITECIEKLQIDTCHFKGNYPESIYVEAGCARNLNKPIHDESVDHDDVKFNDLTIEWFPLLFRTKLGPDKLYTFELEKGQLTEPVPEKRPYISHIRVNIYPDGGISRVRAFGRPKRMVGELNRVLSGMRISKLAALGD